jgi:acyl-coenzyme A synthetase/AMP-(fatty) acid ligase
VLARPGGQQDSNYLVRMLAEHEVTILQLVPSLLRVLLEEPGFAQGTALRRVICAGEALPAELHARFTSQLKAKLHNLYGPTEAAIDVTSWPCPTTLTPITPIAPIGRPIANTQIYLLDAQGRLAPEGVPGELHIGGENLARGYLHQPALTAERFIPHPFSAEPGARLYKTGDLARWLPDGNIEFLGRLDQQVKLRGFRIELGEIEAALREHPAVREAVVLAREERLIAYLVSAQTPTDLRAFLHERLPDYMIPATFVTLAGLPLTPNGKVDRRALPAPEQTRPELTSAYVAPRNPIEEQLAAIAAPLLRVERVGVYDNFFELGGHSLLATQFIARLRTAFQVELPLRSLFEGPSIAAVAVALEQAKTTQPEPHSPALKAIPRETRQVKPAALTR